MNQDIQSRLERLRKQKEEVLLVAQRRRREDIALILNNMDIFERPEPKRELTKWQKEVASARQALINLVEENQKKSESFLVSASRFEKIVQQGMVSEELVELINSARVQRKASKQFSMSKRTLMDWKKIYDGSLTSLAPAIAWNNELPDWVKPMFQLFSTMEPLSIRGAVSLLREQGLKAELKGAKKYIKQLADRIREEETAISKEKSNEN